MADDDGEVMFFSQHSDVPTQPTAAEQRWEVVLFRGRGNLGAYDPSLILDRKLLDDEDVLTSMWSLLGQVNNVLIERRTLKSTPAIQLLVEGVDRVTFERSFSQAVVATRWKRDGQMRAIAETVHWWQDYQFLLNELAAEFPQCKPMAEEFDRYPCKGECDEWNFVWILKKILDLRNNDINFAVYNHRNMSTALVNFTTRITFEPKTDEGRRGNVDAIAALMHEDKKLYEALGGTTIADKLEDVSETSIVYFLSL
jgi:hypothetical protein